LTGQAGDFKQAVGGIGNAGRHVMLAGIEIMAVLRVHGEVRRISDFSLCIGADRDVSTHPEKMGVDRFLLTAQLRGSILVG